MSSLMFDEYNATSYNSSVPVINSSLYNWNNVSCGNSSLPSFDSTDWTNFTYEFVSPVKGAGKYICYVFYGLALFFGIIGNMIVFYVIGYRKKKRNSADIFILSLACADFLASMGMAMLYVNVLITGFYGWLYGKTLCYILPGISQTTRCASGWFLVLISLDRYRIISKPLAQKYHWSVLYGGVAFVWLSSMGVVLPETLKYRVTDYGCFPYEDAAEVTSSFIKATVYVVYSPFSPILLIIIVYYLTARALKMNTMRHENNRAMELRNKRNAKIVRMFIIIIMLYFLLTIPHAISYIYGCYVFFVDTWNSNYEIINTMTYILSIPASANCCVNPIIYARMHRDISKYLGSVIQRIKRACFQFCKRRNESTPAPSATWSLSTLKSN